MVDDEPPNIQGLCTLLNDEYRIQVSTSGDKALAIVHDQSQPLPDLILLDIQMPVIDGYEVCRRLKEDPKTDMLERFALLDGLTGIHNRRYFDEQLEKEIGRNLREDRPLSVSMMDIDHFKELNDHYGHGARVVADR